MVSSLDRGACIPPALRRVCGQSCPTVTCRPLTMGGPERRVEVGSHPTRLETRTKESNMCASRRVLQTKLARRNESEASAPMRVPRGEIPSRIERAHPQGVRCREPPLVGEPAERTRSVHVGTRKMVTYAWPGRSQGKPWWRTAAILTCKSIVGVGYRGERLIEPSSSWFPPKFPSG